jgi:hypothetical protein
MQHHAKGILYTVINFSPYHAVTRWSDTTISSTIKTKDYTQEEKKTFRTTKKVARNGDEGVKGRMSNRHCMM